MENSASAKEGWEMEGLEILSDDTRPTSWLEKTNLADLIKRNIKSNISDPETARKVTEAYGFERIKLGGTQIDIINGSPPLAPKEHIMEITEGGESRAIKFNRQFSFEEAVRKVYDGDSIKAGSLLSKYEGYRQKQEKGPAKFFSEKASGAIENARKMGFVQGVCECVAAIGSEAGMAKKLLSETKVTRDMAKKYANPETFKTLEKGIFAQKPEQKLEQTHIWKM